MSKYEFPKPFDGAISEFFENEAPKKVRKAIEDSNKDDILNPNFPFDQRMDKDEYKDQIDDLQIELVKMQSWAQETGARIAIVFEGRDAAGKGGTIKRFRENLNPRGARVVALSKPSEVEQGQWYFQRYIQHLPTKGEIVFFDRSWYNRGVVEHVFGFCTDKQRAEFFDQVSEFENMLKSDGIRLFKIWLTVGQAEQLNRFLKRETDPLKHWKLSSIDVKGLYKWDAYTKAILDTFDHSNTKSCPWTVVRSDDKKRARLGAIRSVLQHLDYTGKDIEKPDKKIVGSAETLDLL